MSGPYIDPAQGVSYPYPAVQPHFPWPAGLVPPNDYQQNPAASLIPRAISSDYHLYHQLFQDDTPPTLTHQQLTAPNTEEPPLQVVPLIRDDDPLSQTASAAGPAEQAWDKLPTQHRAPWPSTDTSQQIVQNIYAQTPTKVSSPSTTAASSTSPHNANFPEYTTHPSVEQPQTLQDVPPSSSMASPSTQIHIFPGQINTPAGPSNSLYARLSPAPFNLKDPESTPGRQLAFVLLPLSKPAWLVDDSPKPSFHPGLPNENRIRLTHKGTLSRHSTAPFNDFNTSGKEGTIHPRKTNQQNVFGQIGRTGPLTSSKPPLVELNKAQTAYQNQRHVWSVYPGWKLTSATACSRSMSKQGFKRYESASGLDPALGGEIARLPRSFPHAISQPAPAEVRPPQPVQKRKFPTDGESSPSTTASSSRSTKRQKLSHTAPSPETIRAFASGPDQAFGGEMAPLPRHPPQTIALPAPEKAKSQPRARRRKEHVDEDSSPSESASSSTEKKESITTPSLEAMWQEAAALIAAASPHYKPIVPRRRPTMTFGSWQAYDSKDVGGTPSARSRAGSGSSSRRM